MKKTLLILLLMTGLTWGVSAQDRLKEKDVPAAVLSSFKSAYPEARDIQWKMKEGKYKVEFDVGTTNQIAAFDASGKMLSKGIEIRESELPATIASAVKTSNPDRTIDDVYKVEKDGATHYLVKLNGNPEKKILYSADGQEIKEK